MYNLLKTKSSDHRTDINIIWTTSGPYCIRTFAAQPLAL